MDHDGSPLKGGILTFDLSSRIGWAYGHSDARIPEFGEIELPKYGGEGARFLAAQNAMGDLMTEFEPLHVCCEAPIPLPAMNNRDVAFQQLGLRAIARVLAYIGSAGWHERDVFKIREEATGTGRLGPDVKDIVVRWCWRKGWEVTTHNMADACLVWNYYRTRLITT